jgi:Type VI secretion system/phage-baseplate injector OB domain
MSVDSPATGTYVGKYKAVVVNNVDPLFIGRIQVIVPDVASVVPSTWAMPCVPVAGINMGMFSPPLIGSGVWVEFERGDPSKPIWVGCYWGLGAEVPVLSRLVPPAVPGITLQTTLKNGIVISDVPGPTGGILIQALTGAMISVSDVGIVISNGKGAVINMMGPSIQMIGTPVDMNAGALTVT